MLLAVDLFVGAIAAFVTISVTSLVAFGTYAVMFPEETAADRLERLTAAANAGGPTDLMAEREARAMEALAARLGRLAAQSDEKKEEEATSDDIKDLLKYAGYGDRRALEVFQGVRVAALLLLPVVASPLAFFVEDIKVAAMAMLLGMLVGAYGPGLIVRSQAANRQATILRAYPDALDLLVSSVESGLSLDQAFKRVAAEMKAVSPVLAREFQIVNSQMGAGVERPVALKRLAERTGLAEIKSFVNTLNQAEKYGSSIADSMRMYSAIAREKRMSRLEEKAGQVGSKLTIIMIIFFLPVLITILMAPSAIRIMLGEG
jgi:tight adherence protein C